VVARTARIVVVGAGVGGLVTALELASHGLDVLVIERTAAPGGKMREIDIDGHRIDAGPTVLTMRWVFETIFAAAGADLAERVRLTKADILARHAWSERERLDLFADEARSVDAIGDFAGAGEARRYRAFCARARAVYDTLEAPFITAAEPTPLSLTLGAGLKGFGDLWRISPFSTLWSALGTYFHDPRLRQLFGRYATYCGSSPFAAPATLMLVAHVEQDGVWLVEGGMHQLAVALAKLASECGARFRYDSEVSEVLAGAGGITGVALADGERVDADAIVVNADAGAIAGGRLGCAIANAVAAIPQPARSLSAMTWALVAKTSGFPLTRHNVFFSGDYASEFDAIFQARVLPSQPTVYVCAQDRSGRDGLLEMEEERLLCLVNAPAVGDIHSFPQQEIERCEERAFGQLARCGLEIEASPLRGVVTTPDGFERLYPGSGGALYGQASHGWAASFTRPRARTRIPGLYLAGGSVHPGPGVPMAALSGRLAAASIIADLISRERSRPAAMSGGISMR
jgi:1-hydroxycarotenoid 3,4-desaturase